MKFLRWMTEDERLALLAKMEMVEFTEYDGYSAALPTQKELFVKIEPGGCLPVHIDTPGTPRIQHVLLTNDGALCTVNGLDYRLRQGGVYELDSSLSHGAVNDGDTDRVHFVAL